MTCFSDYNSNSKKRKKNINVLLNLKFKYFLRLAKFPFKEKCQEKLPKFPKYIIKSLNKNTNNEEKIRFLKKKKIFFCR